MMDSSRVHVRCSATMYRIISSVASTSALAACRVAGAVRVVDENDGGQDSHDHSPLLSIRDAHEAQKQCIFSPKIWRVPDAVIFW